MVSKRTKAFKRLFNGLPDHIKANARKQYKVFLENQSHPSLRQKPVGSTRNNKFKVYEVTVGMGYKFNDIAKILCIHPVTAGRCAEKGKKLIGNYEGIWDILDKRS